MCGIAGALYFDASRTVDPALLRRMNEVLAHRGPDDAGTHVDGPVGLAHRRLSIIDLSPGGHQPMASASGDHWITYNGEIYNFLELRRELEGAGIVFRSRSDTEVILALYERFGVECLRYLRGMFAFAIWDARRRTLFVARDRLGKKPLYYYRDAEKVLFASEPKGILQDATVPVTPDVEAIHHYLSYGYVPSPLSAFRGIRKLPPAHWLLVADGALRVERYWDLRYRPKAAGSEAHFADELRARLEECVRLRMISSDVPVGAFLSGGIDSSAVVALMSGLASRPVKTFSIGFEEERYNELPYARMVAERYGTDHHEFVVKPDAVEVLPDLVWHYNEPFADSSAIPTYYLAKMTAQHVKVALNGDAGDENFAGYLRYAANRAAWRYDRLPALVRHGVERAVAALPERGHTRSLYRRGKRFFTAIAEEPRRRYARWVTIFPNAAKAALYTPAFHAATAHVDAIDLLVGAYDAVDADNVLDATLGVDVATYLPDDLLVKVDIASMAHSLEARSPMVDHTFMEFAASLPPSMKLKGLTTKHILRQAVGPLLPRPVLDRPKMGFGVPIDRWFRHELREMAYDTLLSRRALDRDLFRADAVRTLLDDHVSGRTEGHPGLWSLLVLELWFQRFVDGRGAASGSAR